MCLNLFSRTGRVLCLLITICFLAAFAVFHNSTTFSSTQWRNSWPLSQQSSTTTTTNSPESPDRQPSTLDLDNVGLRCSSFPDPGNVAIAVKTGATEAVEKIPMLMLTALQCAQNTMIFSDLDQEITGYHLHDALVDVPRSAMQGNSDFDFYWRLKEAQKLGEVEEMLRDARDPRMPQDLAAWTLDKYKQLHILEKLYAAYSDKDWFLMIDADTYIVWPNLLTWLQQLPDPSKHRLYLGSPAVVGDVQFAHGGSGILLSKLALQEFVSQGLASKWDQPMHEECCGDLIIGTELKNSNIPLKPSWPTVNGEKPATLPFGPTHWCQPVVTMHHVVPHEMNQLANYELARNDTHIPMTFASLYHGFVDKPLPESLEDWDNLSRDKTFSASSYDLCWRACEEDQECFQFAHAGDECSLGHSILLGRPHASEEGVHRRSGWLNSRIDDWVKQQPPCTPVFPWTGHEYQL